MCRPALPDVLPCARHCLEAQAYQEGLDDANCHGVLACIECFLYLFTLMNDWLPLDAEFNLIASLSHLLSLLAGAMSKRWWSVAGLPTLPRKCLCVLL